MRTEMDVMAAQGRLNAQAELKSLSARQTDSAVVSYPPGYITGLGLTIDEHGQIVVAIGAANVAGRSITQTAAHTFDGTEWLTPRVTDKFYYVYVTPERTYYIDAVEPELVDSYFDYYHPVQSSARNIGKMFVAIDNSFAIATLRGSAQRGYVSLSMTNIDNTSEPKFLGDVEVNSILVEFLAPTVGTGWAGLGTSSNVWVKVNVDGLITYTATDPAWDQGRGGWYYENDRYVAWLRKDLSGDYLYKHFMPTVQSAEVLFTERLPIGDWDMDATTSVNVSYDLDRPSILRSITAWVRNDADGEIGVLGQSPIVGGVMQVYISSVNLTTISLYRVPGGSFDTIDYDSTSFNRGYVVFEYAVL